MFFYNMRCFIFWRFLLYDSVLEYSEELHAI